MSDSPPSAIFSQPSRWRSVLAIGCGIAGFPIWLAAAVALDINGHRGDPGGHWDAIVVAGCPVRPDGQPTAALMRRTTKAVELWQKGLAPVIVLTGGVSKWPPAEAVAAARFARELGVPEAALMIEDRSKTTAENARFARKLALFDSDHAPTTGNDDSRQGGARSGLRIIVVTDSYHVRRCEWLFGAYFDNVAGVGVTSPLFERGKGAFREAIAYAYCLLLPNRTH